MICNSYRESHWPIYYLHRIPIPHEGILAVAPEAILCTTHVMPPAHAHKGTAPCGMPYQSTWFGFRDAINPNTQANACEHIVIWSVLNVYSHAMQQSFQALRCEIALPCAELDEVVQGKRFRTRPELPTPHHKFNQKPVQCIVCQLWICLTQHFLPSSFVQSGNALQELNYSFRDTIGIGHSFQLFIRGKWCESWCQIEPRLVGSCFECHHVHVWADVCSWWCGNRLCASLRFPVRLLLFSSHHCFALITRTQIMKQIASSGQHTMFQTLGRPMPRPEMIGPMWLQW